MKTQYAILSEVYELDARKPYAKNLIKRDSLKKANAFIRKMADSYKLRGEAIDVMHKAGQSVVFLKNGETRVYYRGSAVWQ